MRIPLLAPMAWIASIASIALIVASVPGAASARAADRGPAIQASAVATVGMTVSDMPRALDFYTRILPFEKDYDIEVSGRSWEQLHGVFGARMRVVGLHLGDERLELTEYLAPRGRPMPVDSRANDRWFQHVAIIVRDMDRAYAHLASHGLVHASTAPQRLPEWNVNAAGIEAFYFRDPDGHFLEILKFPPGKGDPKWHRRDSDGEGNVRDLFLGVDHTAIVVSDTDAAVAFYRDVLGLRVAGEGENHGVEQEHLNGVFGVRLRITTLRAREGAGVELLEYRAPRDGRATPADLRANDVAHWQITMQAEGVARLLIPTRRFSLVSPDVTAVDAAPLGFARGLLVRDPDGHAVRVVER